MERDESAFAAGRDAAKNDIAVGRLIYRWSGHSGHWGHWIVTQLEQRFGVEVDDGFGICMVTASSVSFNDGYNAILVAEIDRRHGEGAFDALLTEAESQSEEALWTAKERWLKQHGLD